MDEPFKALDLIFTLKIEETMQELKKKLMVIIVTHIRQQALRVSEIRDLTNAVEYDDGEKERLFICKSLAL